MGTGTTDIIERCEKAGLRTPEFYQDEDFRTILWRPVEKVAENVTGNVTDHVTGNVTGNETGNVTGKVNKLILAVRGDTKTREEIMHVLQLKGSGNFREGYLYPALSEGYIAKLYPDAVSRTDQAYYLTPKGLELLKKLNK
jgi:predicted HTH transcriptional regulator